MSVLTVPPMVTALGLTEGEFTAVTVMLSTIAVALIGGVFALIKIWVSQRAQRSEIAAIKTATTVNHHASETPTLVDRLDTVQQSLTGLTATVEAHHHEQQRRNDTQDDRLARGLVRFQRIEDRIDTYHGRDAT